MENKKIKLGKSLIFGVIIFTFFLAPFLLLAADQTQQKTTAEPNIILEVPLLSYSKATNIAEYIKNIYKASLYIIIPFIIVIIIGSGILWILAGGDKKLISTAKERIKFALIGLGIALFSYVLLSFVGITELKPPQVEYIEAEEALDAEDPAQSIPMSKGGVTTGKIPTPPGINCPKSGGPNALQSISDSMRGKVTYRMGAKRGSSPPYGDKKMCGDQPCSNFCPTGTICLDCSGFVWYAYACAGMKTPTGATAFTGSIFANCTKITSVVGLNVNGVPLQAGDMLGYTAGGSESSGHVLLYVGNGKIYESHGGGGMENNNSGRKPGNAIKVTSFANHNWIDKCIRKYGS